GMRVPVREQDEHLLAVVQWAVVDARLGLLPRDERVGAVTDRDAVVDQALVVGAVVAADAHSRRTWPDEVFQGGALRDRLGRGGARARGDRRGSAGGRG